MLLLLNNTELLFPYTQLCMKTLHGIHWAKGKQEEGHGLYFTEKTAGFLTMDMGRRRKYAVGRQTDARQADAYACL